MNQKTDQDRLSRLESSTGINIPQQDPRRQELCSLLYGIAERNPALCNGSPVQRAQAERSATNILMHEMEKRMAAGGKTDSDTARALAGLLEFQREEDWEA
jgi:hypothetical protein